MSSIVWSDPPASTAEITCKADGSTLISPAPVATAIYATGSTVSGISDDASFVLLTSLDEAFSSYPAYLGVTSRQVASAIPTGVFGVPLLRSPLDVSASPLLNSGGDSVIMGTFNPWTNQPVASISATLLAGADSSTNGVSWKSGAPYIMRAWGPSGPPPGANRFPLSQSTGSPGTYSFVAFSQASDLRLQLPLFSRTAVVFGCWLIFNACLCRAWYRHLGLQCRVSTMSILSSSATLASQVPARLMYRFLHLFHSAAPTIRQYIVMLLPAVPITAAGCCMLVFTGNPFILPLLYICYIRAMHFLCRGNAYVVSVCAMRAGMARQIARCRLMVMDTTRCLRTIRSTHWCITACR